MNACLIPEHLELRRLVTLRELNLLDTPRESRFDAMVRVASDLFNTPVATITLLDRHRQWFKASIGLDVAETERSASFCQFAVASGECLIVNDARQDPRFSENPLVTGPMQIRSYMGAPLLCDGIVIGALCVIDQKPRFFHENDAHQLQALADWVSIELSRDSRAHTGISNDQRLRVDPLTGLNNRSEFEQSIRDHQSRAGGGVILMNIDRFRAINDALGFAGGDTALGQFALRLMDLLAPDELAARLCGDDFAVFVPGTSPIGVKARAHALGTMLESEPLCVGDYGFPLRLSVGFSTGDDLDADKNLVDPSRLIEQANMAVLEIKRQGQRRVCAYDPALSDVMRRRLKLSSDLQYTVSREQLQVVYQPQWERTVDGWAMYGVEALVRWRHPELGPISPAEFIPLAEENGKIIEIGQHVLTRALADTALLQQQEKRSLILSINLSPIQLMEADLIPFIERRLKRFALTPAQLELEVTETALIRDLAAASHQLNCLHQMGLRLALDDFGTGFSSLTHIRELPFNTIKIDRAFVRDLPDAARNLAIIDGVQAMARGLKKDVIAEGVETEAQLECLVARGIHRIQGYLMGKPMPVEDLQRLDRSIEETRFWRNDY